MNESNPPLFFKVMALHEEKNLSWEAISQEIPLLPKGWFELSRLPKADRIEFTKEFWISKLSFATQKGIFLEERLIKFFDLIDEIGVVATQETKSSAFEVHMVYSLKEESAFFQGGAPANNESITNLCRQFESIHFPTDYLGFLQIHDGFSKYTDRGLIKTKEMARTYLKFQEQLQEEIILSTEGSLILGETLIPFYESEELHGYRCFYTEWYPEKEMGNVCYSNQSNQEVHILFEEGPAYPNFLAWLLDYLEERCTA